MAVRNQKNKVCFDLQRLSGDSEFPASQFIEQVVKIVMATDDIFHIFLQLPDLPFEDLGAKKITWFFIGSLLLNIVSPQAEG